MSGSEVDAMNSLQCDICGVKLRNAAAAQIHAEKTEHQAFSESEEKIKPLTEEEKKAKLQDLRDKLAAKRKVEADKELENVKKNASIERKKTQESAELIEELKHKEELKVIAAKKKEKEQDLLAKQRVRAQLEQDKKDRADRAARDKAARSAAALPSGSVVGNLGSDAQATPKKVVDHTSGRLQVRFAGGKPIVRTWPKDVTMFQVAADISSETGIAPDQAVFKMFGQVIRGPDLQRSLQDLKLVPSASLQMS